MKCRDCDTDSKEVVEVGSLVVVEGVQQMMALCPPCMKREQERESGVLLVVERMPYG